MTDRDPTTYRFFLQTVDPVHIGTGGTRLGRVDMSIVREPGTRLPKIPGTSLSGAIRAYAAYRYGKRQCAGQGQSQGSKHCGQPTCPICYTFGTASESGKSYAGVVSIGDARILLFPVYSMVGPVWVTSPSALYDAGFGEKDEKGVLRPFEVDKDEQGFARWNFSSPDHINLGWLMVEREQEEGKPEKGNLPEINWPENIPEPIRNRVVLVSDKLFSQIVNSNLEVRTSVSINPETGAAEDGALFTYEAIPRATVLWMDVVVDDYRGEFPTRDKLDRWEKILHNGNNGDKQKQEGLLSAWRLWNKKKGHEEFKNALEKAQQWLASEKTEGKWRWDQETMQGVEHSPIGIVTAGLEWAEHLGIGGMGTRGFGRIRTIMACIVEEHNQCKKEEE